MADVLGTVVGVISFGLQVCSGIAKYLDGIEGHRDEIASATRLCETLQGLLDDLQARRNDIATASHGNPVAIERAMASANAELGGLRAFVDEVRISDDPSKSFSEWIRDRTRRTVYPFRRPRLGRLETQLSEANKMLQTALQVVQFEISIETGNAIRSVETEVSMTRTELNTKLDYLQQASTEDHHTMEKLSDDLSQVSLSLETFVPHAQQHMEASSVQLTRVESRIEEVVSALVSSESRIVMRRLLMKPDALRLACREADIDNQPSSSLNSLQTARQDNSTMYSMFSCRCHPRRIRKQTRRGFSSAFFTAESLVEKVHAIDCPLAGATSQKSWSFGISTKAFRTLIFTAITISMSSTSGAGGFSICPSLRICFIRTDSPAFDTVELIAGSAELHEYESFSLVLQKGIQALQWVFKSGKASPLDVHYLYGNLLHRACFRAGLLPASDMWKLRPLLAFLAAVGVPKDRPKGRTTELPFQTLFRQSAHTLAVTEYYGASNATFYKSTGLFASVALDYQFLIPSDTSVISDCQPIHRPPTNPMSIKFYHEVARALPKMTEWYGNALHTAIIRRDEAALAEVLKKDTERATPWEKDAFGYAAFDLLASWTRGLELVLFHWGSQVLQTNQRSWASMLYCALGGSKEMCSVYPPARCPRTCGCADNVLILLEAGYLLDLSYSMIMLVLQTSMRCQEVVIGHIKKRREELACLALNRLSPTEINDFGVSEETTLDIRTQEVVEALERRGVQVPQRLLTQAVSDESRCSLYHQISCLDADTDTRHLLNVVHSNGFREIDASDYTGITPSMVARRPLTFMNLVKMGADPTLQVPGSVAGFTTTHRFFGRRRCKEETEKDFREMFTIKEQVQMAHGFPPGDECICECADNGCNPYSVLCKWIFDCSHYRTVGCRPELVPDRLSDHLAPVPDGHWDMPEDFKLIAVRMATFESLSIHHTCCDEYGERRDIDDEDVEEFLEEDSRAIEILHELLPEFEAKLVEMNCSFSEFMGTYWKDRMVQILEELNEPQPLTEDNLREIRRLGVNLQVEDKDEDEAAAEYDAVKSDLDVYDWIMREIDA